MAEGIIEVTEGSGKKVSTISCTINSETVHIERALEGIGLITLPSTAQVALASTTGLKPAASFIDVQGRFYIICKNTFSTNIATAKYRIAFYDTADTLIGYSEEITIENFAIAESTRYMGNNVIYSNDFGAKSIKIYITEITAGANISIFVGVT